MNDAIVIRGARTHNLKNIDVKIARKKMTVITGVSGSGKSSLAFDTVYAEGQRRYVESLSAYARQFLEKMDKPDVDSVDGILPAVAIQQGNPVRSSRSTVGTATEIHDYLRLLFARIGKIHCPGCGQIVERDDPGRVAGKVSELPSGSRIMVAFQLKVVSETDASEKLDQLVKSGFVRALVAGEVKDLEDLDPGEAAERGEIEVVVDRLVVKPDIRARLVDSTETAFRHGDGAVSIVVVGGEVLRFSQLNHCPRCDVFYDDPHPLLFSFNSPLGACTYCNGFGNMIELDMDLIVPDKSKSINENAVKPWAQPMHEWVINELRLIAHKYGLPLDTPFKDLAPEHLQLIMEGEEYFPGIKRFFEMVEKKKYKLHVRVFLSRYRSYVLCPECKGSRLKKESLDVKINGTSIDDICKVKISEAHRFFRDIKLPDYEREVANLLLAEIERRLGYLVSVGLDYLTLDRQSKTLSGGEAQRINLATSLGSALTGTLYVLDEPSIGLHPRDNARLIGILHRLRDMGNTVLVVEHDRDVMQSSDDIIDMGPGAGEDGGRIIFRGSYEEILKNKRSLTGQYLRHEKQVELPAKRRRTHREAITLYGCKEHNLKNIDVTFPLGQFVCVTGVSGSGKSTLVHDILYQALRRSMGMRAEKVGAHSKLKGAESIDDVVMVDQSPIGRTPRSNPVTYIKAFTNIRALFASTREARQKGWGPGRFSFNVPGGRCEKCKGDGAIKVEMQFFADVYVPCEVCGGKRFRPSTLEVKYRGKSMHDVLSMTLAEALDFFRDSPKIMKTLKVLDETGLGYLNLGQPATTLSGGEAQRLKLAAHIAEARSHNTLFIFDEPTTGLHFDDIKRLLACLNKLLEMGNSIITIEHNLDIVRWADHIIDLGPDGGDAGGRVTLAGTVEDVMQCKESHTGKFLKTYLAWANRRPRKKMYAA